MTIALPNGELLRGAQTPDELDLSAYAPLARKWARKYDGVLGYEDALQAAHEGLVVARDRWNPTRGPFQSIAALYVKTYLRVAADARLRQDGVATRDRPSSKRRRESGHEFRPAETYSIVSLDSPIGPDRDGGTIESVLPSSEPDPETVLLDEERDLAIVERVREAVLTHVRDKSRRAAIIDALDAGDDKAIARAIGRLDWQERSRLAEALADLAPSRPSSDTYRKGIDGAS